jgi:hypothetical protein
MQASPGDGMLAKAVDVCQWMRCIDSELRMALRTSRNPTHDAWDEYGAYERCRGCMTMHGSHAWQEPCLTITNACSAPFLSIYSLRDEENIIASAYE